MTGSGARLNGRSAWSSLPPSRLSLGGIVLGTQIMSFVFGAPYAAGGLAFKILAATLLFDFPASIIINALFAYEHQKSLIVSSALGGVVNVGLDLALIPFFGIAGIRHRDAHRTGGRTTAICGTR